MDEPTLENQDVAVALYRLAISLQKYDAHPEIMQAAVDLATALRPSQAYVNN